MDRTSRRRDRWLLEFDRQPVGQRRFRDVAHQPEFERSREGPTLVVLGRDLRRGELQRVLDAGEPLEADELQGPLVAAAARALRRDQHVDFRLLPVAHVIDEGDFGAEVVEVAALAVEEDAQRCCVRLRGGGEGAEEKG